MLEGTLAVEGGEGEEGLFFVCQHIKKDRAVGTVFLRVLVAGRRALVGAGGVFLAEAVLVAGLSATLSLDLLIPALGALPFPH